MRLLFVAPDMHRGGAERQWATLIPELAARGADVRLLCLNDEGPLFDDMRAAGVPAACLHLGGRADARGLRRALAEAHGRADARGLRRALAEAHGRPGAVVTRGVSPQLVGEAIARRAGAAHVLNEHTPLTADGELLPTRAHQRALTRLVAPLVDRVIAVTERQAAPLQRLGYRAERIVTVPNGVFEADVALRADPAQTRRELRVIGGEFAVLCVANLRPEKGVEAFVEAVLRAREQEPRLRGFVAGDGPQRGGLEQLVAGREGVELLGSRGDVPDLIAASDAVCLLSEAEALPISILEAMALGRPVVTTDVGGTPEAVAHEQTGLVVTRRDAATALARLASQPRWARELGERGRARQRERFSGEAMIEGYERALAEVATR
jgi:glycosyltransferase involved in cell wall biosynthesis